MSLFQALDNERQTLGACISLDNLLRDLPNILLYTIRNMQKQNTKPNKLTEGYLEMEFWMKG